MDCGVGGEEPEVHKQCADNAAVLLLPVVRFARRRFGIGIFYCLLYMLLEVAFDSEGWLVQLGNVVQLLYLFLIIVQVRVGVVPAVAASSGDGWPPLSTPQLLGGAAASLRR